VHREAELGGGIGEGVNRLCPALGVSSVSMSTLPLYLGSKRSQMEFTSGASFVFTISPVIPLCQGTVKSR
jgi:hypothetical protein